MANEYYNHGGAPAQGSNGSSIIIRAEFDAIVLGMAKLPTMAGNASKFVIVNATATGLSVATYTPAASGANSDITSLTGLTTALSPSQGGTGTTSNAGAPFALKGVNADITQLTAITTALSIAQGGTGATTNAGTAYALKGVNADITQLTALTTALTLAQGGTGQTTAAGALVALGERTSQTGSVVSPAGTTGQRDGIPATGYLRYNSTNDAFEGYLVTGWGSFATLATAQTFTNKTITGVKETRVTMPANDMDMSTGNLFSKTITVATTFTVSNIAAAGSSSSFILDLTNGGAFVITWFAGVKWASGTAPTLTASGRDVLGFFTHDGGTTWSGLVMGKDLR